MHNPLYPAMSDAFERAQKVRLFTTVGVYEGRLSLNVMSTRVILLDYCSSVDPQLAGPKLMLDLEGIKGFEVLH